MGAFRSKCKEVLKTKNKAKWPHPSTYFTICK